MQKPQRRALVFLAHGSRDPAWKLPIEAIARHASQLDPALMVGCAYLESTEPDLVACMGALVATGATQVSVVPVFLGMGQHVRTDLPQLLTRVQAQFPALAVSMQTPVGESVEVLNLIGRIATQKESLT